MTQLARPLEPGTPLDPYSVTATIGEGGMGKVYRARDTKLDRDVALKVLPQVFKTLRDSMLQLSHRWFIVGTLVVLAGCGDRTPPVVSGQTLTVNPSGRVPLAAVARLTTDEPSQVTVEVRAGEETWSHTPDPVYNVEHSVVVLGLQPDRTHQIVLVATDEAGNEVRSSAHEVTTPPLPADFPPITVAHSRPDQMESGVTVFSVYRRAGDDRGDDYGLIVAVNAKGEVVWYYRSDERISDVRRLGNGNLLHNGGTKRDRMSEIDMVGHVVRQWHAAGVSNDAPSDSIPIATDSLHHEVYEMPSGNFLALSTELRRLEDYPSSETDPAARREPANVVGGVIVEFTPDGDIARKVKLFDLLDPYRIGYDSLGTGFWRGLYEQVADGDTRDWTHDNAIIYDARDDSAIVSLRHADAVIKVGMATGELEWILGNHEGWKPPQKERLLEPVGDIEWTFHQHAPMLTPHGTLLLYDNGNYRVRPYDEKPPLSESYSRVVEYAVDEEAHTVSQVWEYGGPGDNRFFSNFGSDADWLPTTGNVLITHAGLTEDVAGTPDDTSDDIGWARIVEVTHTTPAEIVFDLVIKEGPEVGWRVYRAERLASLYP